ncbi:Holliday junction resolvase RuvX [bacterium]|nr:Holliday junction resolvase RuvX [bacterium]
MKVVALDLGDRWVGVAISDALKMTCRPYDTVELHELEKFLKDFLKREPIEVVVVGLPITLKGTESDQTRKIKKQADYFKSKMESFGISIKWVFWDERLSSKMASSGARTPEAKRREHAVAASYILQGYLDYSANECDTVGR